MRPLARLLAFALVAGCGGSNPGSGTPGSGSPDMANASGGTTVAPDGTVTLTMTPFTIPAGAEVYKCQEFKNPWGADTEIKVFESHMTAGSHHLLLFYKAGVSDGPLVDCSGLEFSATPYGSQLPDDSVTFPDGVSALVPSAQGFRLQVHYLNASPNPVTPSVQVLMHPAQPGTTTAHAGVLFFFNTKLSIPSTGQPYSLSKTCQIPTDINLLLASSHMHKHATNFVATASAGPTLYTTTDWSEPKPATFAPPQPLAAGSTVTFTCTWVNDTGTTLTFGESAQTNEMCIFSGQFYPIQGTQNVLPCL
jgi:hypothetical protein